MARKFTNEKGFTIYEMTGIETMEFGGYGIVITVMGQL